MCMEDKQQESKLVFTMWRISSEEGHTVFVVIDNICLSIIQTENLLILLNNVLFLRITCR